VIAIATEGDDEIADIVDDVLYIPEVPDIFMPFLATVVLQLLALYVAEILGTDIDRPRNLAKSVTVE
jgi:glucosamine--fructose-6-phosphate aminotransferase (isomerizing)